VAPETRDLRVLTINFWGTEPPLDRRLDLAIRQLRALAPDVICMQEVRPLDGKSGRTTAHVIADALGMHAHYATACSWNAGDGPMKESGQEGLAILSRTAPLATRELPLPEGRPALTRILLSAQIATDADPVWLHTTHLHYALDDGLAREKQVLAIDAAIRADRTATSPPHILTGDMNCTPDSDEMRFLRGLTTLDGRRTHWQDAWLRHHPHEDGFTWSSENELTRPLRSLDIDRRLDYVYVTSRKKDGRATIHDCQVVLTERDAQGEFCATDHYGVLAVIQVVPT
jgi:endonuclease/exonuclease/phosphatase family metal-dependent hydrolase